MIKEISVDCLFGLYTYRLDFANDLHIKFITGPNGYGKTTVLSFIDSIIRKDLDIFFQIPFDTVAFCFEENILTVKQIIESTNSNYSIPYDAKQVRPVKLCISFNVFGSQNTETIYVNKGDSLSGNLALFLSSVSCYYIKDQRLSSTKALLPIGKEPGISYNSLTGNDIVSVNAAKFSELLSDAKKRFYDGLNISRLKFSETTGRENYIRRRKKIDPEISLLIKYGIADRDFTVNEYNEDNSLFLNAYMNALENAVASVRPFVDAVETFRSVIESCTFADKVMEIAPEYGYRFKVGKTYFSELPLYGLSSGEKHIMVLAFELIFCSPEGSIVLIDEPEMSFHLMWQLNFLSQISKIVSLRKLQAIIATHSPQIFSQDWSLATDIYEQSQNTDISNEK